MEKKSTYKKWSKAEEQYLLDNYSDDNISIKEMEKTLKATSKQIYNKAQRMKLTRINEPISVSQINTVTERYEDCKNLNIFSAELGVSVSVIRKYASVYNLKKKHDGRKREKAPKVKKNRTWSSSETKFLIDNARSMTAKEISHQLNIQYDLVRSKIRYLNIEDYKRTYTVGNICFEYNTEEEKQRKLKRARIIRDLLGETGGKYRNVI